MGRRAGGRSRTSHAPQLPAGTSGCAWLGSSRSALGMRRPNLGFYLMKAAKDNLPATKRQAVRSQLVMKGRCCPGRGEEPHHAVTTSPLVLGRVSKQHSPSCVGAGNLCSESRAEPAPRQHGRRRLRWLQLASWRCSFRDKNDPLAAAASSRGFTAGSSHGCSHEPFAPWLMRNASLWHASALRSLPFKKKSLAFSPMARAAHSSPCQFWRNPNGTLRAAFVHGAARPSAPHSPALRSPSPTR